MRLPPAYLELLRTSNGGYAELSTSPWAVDFWEAEQINQLNHEYEVDHRAPDYLAFGSNLGEELLAFFKPDGPSSAVYMLPWHSPDQASARKVCDSIYTLIAAMSESEE